MPRTVPSTSRAPARARRSAAGGVAPALPEDLEALAAIDKARLIALWPLVAARGEPPPAQRSLLTREIAWRAQAKVKGGLDAQTVKLLAKAVREVRRDEARVAAGGPRGPRARAARPASTTRVRAADLPASARLVRVWPAGSGTRHEVTVIDAGKAYEYRGTRYSSLTPIAREITGTHWSGPRFFGLTARHGPARPGGGAP